MANAYLVAFPSGLLLVDCGAPGSTQTILRALHRLGRTDLHLIFITHAHYDHYGCAAELRRLTGARLAAHPAEQASMKEGLTVLGSARGRGRPVKAILERFPRRVRVEPVIPDVLFEDGQELTDSGFPARVIHTPGHTPGSISLLVDGRLIFVGDLLSTSRPPHLQRYYASDWQQLPESLRRVQALQPEWVFAGHGRAPLGSAALRRLGDRIDE